MPQPALAAGDLRDRVVYQECTRAKSASTGEFTETWADVKTRWAEVVELSGTEQETAAAAVGREVVRVRLRYDADYNRKGRFKFGSRYLYIRSLINPEGRRVETIALCEEEKN